MELQRKKLREKENDFKRFEGRVKQQIENAQRNHKENQIQQSSKVRGLMTVQSKVKSSKLSSDFSSASSSMQNHNTFELNVTRAQSTQMELKNSFLSQPFTSGKSSHKDNALNITLPDPCKYYPPSCSGFDMTFCRQEGAIYVYGGISCECDLKAGGIKTFFYKYHKQKWTEVKPESIYCPMPRYSHTLSCYQKDIILFGGVSEYKEKLKDRCFYSDLSIFNAQRNQWRILETSPGGNFTKTRKNHASAVLNSYFFVYGGINENEEVLSELSWINLESKKPRWKTLSTFEPRFNHKMISVEFNGRELLAVFGGRNQQSEIVSSLFLLSISQSQGHLNVKDPISISHQTSAREMPIFQRFSQGFIILGGNDHNNKVVADSWYYNAEKQAFEELKQLQGLEFEELRGSHGVAVGFDKIYILGSNSKTYKAIEVEIEK